MSDGDAFLWPDVPRTAFRAGGAPPYASAIAWAVAEDGFDAYATGYRRAAEAIFAGIGEDWIMSPDIVVFPLAMVWRHSFELWLKEIIRLGQQAGDEPVDVPTGHSLRKLWEVALPYITPLGDPSSPVLRNVSDVIAELHKLDESGQAFRYPLLRDGRRALEGIPAVIDLHALQSAMISVANFFDGVSAALHVRRDALWELQHRDR